ncbi:MAG: hypothetical protein ACK4GR_04560, partial [bacterium]
MINIRKKGLTIVEIIISFSVAFILITSIYAIIYWGLKVNTINEYYLDVNNILIFISNEVQNNPSLYLQYDSNRNRITLTQDAEAKLLGKLFLYNYKIKNKQDYQVKFEKIERLTKENLDRIVKVDISVKWYYKNKEHITLTTIFLPLYNITRSYINPLPENSDIYTENTNTTTNTNTTNTANIINTTTTTTIATTTTTVTTTTTTTTESPTTEPPTTQPPTTQPPTTEPPTTQPPTETTTTTT